VHVLGSDAEDVRLVPVTELLAKGSKFTIAGVGPHAGVGDRRLACTCEKFERDLWFCPEREVLRNAAVTAAFLELVACGPVSRKVDFTAKRPGELIGVVVVTWDGEDAIDANLAGGDFAKRTGVLWFDADAIVAVFEDIDIVDDQHRRRRCDRLRDVLVEMILDGIVLPGTFTDESTNPVFIDVEPFSDTAEGLVTTRTD
jgi:hypothetical protein